MKTLEGRTVLLTGASKGIGGAAAAALAEAGAFVVAHYGSDEAGAREATEAIPAERRLLVQADFADAAAVHRLWDVAVGWRGIVDVLVNNAAIMEETPFGASHEEWRAGWLRTFEVNVHSPATLTRLALRHFLERRSGVVITLSSWVAQRGPSNPSLVAYAASKAAVKALTQTIARHHGKDGVLAYVLAPGVVRTRLSERAATRSGGEDAITTTLAMHEWVPPAELAKLIVFLASGSCRHLSGATLDVNGASYIR